MEDDDHVVGDVTPLTQRVYGGETHHVTISGLSRDSVYNVSIGASTNIGLGVFSTPVSIETGPYSKIFCF